LAIRTVLTLRAVFRLALRQTEGLIGSILKLLRLDLAVPDHSTLSRRAGTLEIPKPCPGSKGPIHLLVDSTGFRLCGPGEWLTEQHGTRRRRSWRKLHIGVDVETGQILASELTMSDVDDGSQVDPCSARSQLLSPPSPVMEPTIKPASTTLSPSAILMLKSLFHHEQPRC
jgi:hypothetical protein